ncbi:patched family-domain-containing protein [Hysterangium stoloniferum]|nr:patched family-domain-containing protein [Hysterangium stoloniferum]
MRGTCGSESIFTSQLPCPYDGPAVEPENEVFRSQLVSICGSSYADGPVCCTSEQLEMLEGRFSQVESIISPCPACRNNFRSFFCSFTCSPDQGTFINVTNTQITSSNQTAVESVDFYVSERFGAGFYNSCKDIKFSASNGYAMDFIGGGAKNYSAFLQFMGEKKDLGSPFQINYPDQVPSSKTPFDAVTLNCYDSDLTSRCSCIDCPLTCPVLPYIPPPGSEPSCHVGAITCLSFLLIITYSLATLAFVIGYLIESSVRRRREGTYERVALSGDAPSGTSSLASNPRGLVGASSLAQHLDGEDSTGGHSDSRHLGRGASLLDPIDTLQPPRYRLNSFFRRSFYKLGASCANHPWLWFCIIFTAIGVLNIGWKDFEIETDPVRLWVAPTSDNKIQKEIFDQNFGPFYRTEQIFITPTMDSDSSHLRINDASIDPILTWDRLNWWFNVENDIRVLRSPNGHTLDDVCFKPSGPSGSCVVQSITGWFDHTLEKYNSTSWAKRISHCASQPTDCLPDFRQPLAPEYVLGGVPSAEESGSKQWLNAHAMIVTYVISDSLDATIKGKAEEWERTLKAFLQQLSDNSHTAANADIVFSTGVSLEEEINKSTNMDIKIVVLSYVVMFIYISLTLGNGEIGPEEEGVVSSLRSWAADFPRLFQRKSMISSSSTVEGLDPPRLFPRLPRRLFVGSKFTLGLFGIMLVIISVSSSVGLFSLLGVKTTLIIAEVIPFLVLAVGVDNVFILVHELDRQNILHGPNASLNALGAGPLSPISTIRRLPFESRDESIDTDSAPLYLSPEERVARTLAKMGPSILLSSISETVAFALGALVPMPAVRNFALYAAGSVFLNAILQVTVFISALVIDLRRTEAGRIDCFPCIRILSRIALTDASSSVGLGRIARFMRRTYAPFLMRGPVKGAVLIIFGGIFVVSVISMQHIQLGLDQRLALPAESYLIPYFNAVDAYLDVGPPVYFVSQEVNVTSIVDQRKLCGRFSTCLQGSLANILEVERNRSESSFISQPAASWIDDFLKWLDPALDACCRVRKDDPTQFCSPQDANRRCRPCFEGRVPSWNITLDGMPEGSEFMLYLRQWLRSPTDEVCPLGGQAAYSTALSLDANNMSVEASHFRTSHSPLKTQEDFINALTAANRIAADISSKTGTKVFPYSLFYVYFDQYMHIIATTQEILGLGLGSVLLVTGILLGSWRTSTIVTGVVALTVVSVMGTMGVWGIMLNAISLVNLVISLGIAVEFSSHIARAFMGAGAGLPVDILASQKERDERMWTALVDVGPSVLSGITFTKLIGISVLALTRSKLLEIYYFRMWLTLIISGALHGLVLLPVVLSLAGGPGYALEDVDEEWMSNVIRRNDYEYTPFLTDDASDNSDNL